MIDDYESYLRIERGLAEGTIAGYGRVAREFLDGCLGSSGLDLEAVTAAGSPSSSPARVRIWACRLRVR